MLELCDDGLFDYLDWNLLFFETGDTQVQLPPSFVPWGVYQPGVINATDLLPGLDLSPNSGTLNIKYQYSTQYPLLLLHSITFSESYPLYPNQSFVWHTFVNQIGESFHAWVKDSPPTPASHPYNSLARAQLNITCVDQFGSPIPNLRISFLGTYGITDATGNFSAQLPASKSTLMVYHASDWELLYLEELVLEPLDVVNRDLVITMTSVDEAVTELIPIKLRAFPSPFISGKHDVVSLALKGNAQSDANVLIYNSKGQFVDLIKLNGRNEASWKPSRKLGNGVYYLRLVSQGSELDRQSIVIIK